LTDFPGLEDGFLSELFPGVGAINTQASYLAGNQDNARERMELGDSPDEIITWLEENDVAGNPNPRQYGVVRIIDGVAYSAAYSGSSTLDYSNHITGSNYAIQGNILLGQEILDSMEARFLRAEGDLACRLMFAMQGANVVGADTRCADNGTSSLFAFLKVADMDDSFGEPSFSISVRTNSGAEIEPIDSLQNLFNASHEVCPHALGLQDAESNTIDFVLYPNPAEDRLNIQLNTTENCMLEIRNTTGQLVYSAEINANHSVDLSGLEGGVYFIQLSSKEAVVNKCFTKL